LDYLVYDDQILGFHFETWIDFLRESVSCGHKMGSVNVTVFDYCYFLLRHHLYNLWLYDLALHI